MWYNVLLNINVVSQIGKLKEAWGNNATKIVKHETYKLKTFFILDLVNYRPLNPH